MIGEVTQATLGAYVLGLFMGRAEFARTDAEYASMKEAMESGLEQMELERLGPVPASRADFDGWASTVIEPVNEALRARRGRLGGDTTALPVFFIAFEDTEADELKELVKDISQEVRDFRAEFRDQTAELARLVRAGTRR